VTRPDLPSGTVTFVFTDIEGSTKLLHDLGPGGFDSALAEHRRVLRGVFQRHGGVEVDTQGDAFFYAFPDAHGAVDAALEGQRELATGPVRVRIGIHTGSPHLGAEGYIGPDVNLGARIGAAGHGGQVLLSKQTRELVNVDALDLGEHRLKDFAEPVWIYQLGPERFPPLKTISNTNLPRPASSFVGREQELKELIVLLQDGDRIVTMTGPGGTGKTRLSIEAASELVPEFLNGVFWVGLAPLRDPELVVPAIAQTLGAKDGLAEHIGAKQMLLVIDNFEQVISAAAELKPLVEACPNLRMLVTSRELLRIAGEVEYPVPPLESNEAVELFCRRSRLEPNATTAELCTRLDNLPLAVELAAARVKVLSPDKILERLGRRLDLLKGGRAADPRQATLRATIEWSHDLLDDAEKQLFARLAVFRGGWTLEAAEEVVDADLDTLHSLVDKSLVRQRDDRFFMLETIREYAAERLASGKSTSEITDRHARWFLSFAEEAEPNVRHDPVTWLEILERDHDNLRAAIDRLQDRGESQLALRLAGALSNFWTIRSHLTEARARLDALIEVDDSPTPARAKALAGAGRIAIYCGDLAMGEVRGEEALTLARRLDDPWLRANAENVLAHAVGDRGDLQRATALLESSVEGFRKLSDETSAMHATYNLAMTVSDAGDGDRARRLLEDNLVRARILGDRRAESMTLGSLAGFACEDGRLAEAVEMLLQHIEIERDLGDAVWGTAGVARLAATIAASGDGIAAAKLLGFAEARQLEIGVAWHDWVAKMNAETLEAIRGQLNEPALRGAFDTGRMMSLEEAIALVRST